MLLFAFVPSVSDIIIICSFKIHFLLSACTNFIYIPIVFILAHEYIDLYKFVLNYIVLTLRWDDLTKLTFWWCGFIWYVYFDLSVCFLLCNYKDAIKMMMMIILFLGSCARGSRLNTAQYFDIIIMKLLMKCEFCQFYWLDSIGIKCDPRQGLEIFLFSRAFWLSLGPPSFLTSRYWLVFLQQ
jgi:hypothetical protein